uniref:GLOBIN domain-containing protein n=1 Tax=Heterorhabditis bacteriophora TaxID=37862 RepID=A0A1I7XJW7_HETBA
MIFHWFLTMMGCNRRKSSSNILTEAEVTAIKEVWSKAKKREVGQKILRALIDHKPQFKDYFGIHVSENNLEELYACKEFQVQAHRVQNFLDTAVSTLGFCPISNVHAMAHRIGQIHFYRGVNFGADNWLAFKKVTVDQVTAELSQREIGSTHGEKQWSRKGVPLKPSLFHKKEKRHCINQEVRSRKLYCWLNNYTLSEVWNSELSAIIRPTEIPYRSRGLSDFTFVTIKSMSQRRRYSEEGFLDEARRNCTEEDPLD